MALWGGTFGVLLALPAQTVAQNSTQWVEKGNQFLKDSSYVEALKAYTEALKADSTNKTAWFQRGTAFKSVYRFREALLDYTRALTLDSTYRQARVQRLELALQFLNFPLARYDLDRLLRTTPTDTTLLAQRGQVLVELQEYGLALADLNKVVVMDSTRWGSLLYRAYALIGINQIPQAEADLKRVLRVNPQNTEARIVLGNLAAENQQLDAALNWYNDALTVDPRAPSAYYNRAKARANALLFTEAKADLDSAIKYNPYYAAAYQLRAQVNISLKDYDATISDSKVSLAISPTTEAYLNWANALYNKKEYEEALLQVNRSLELDPNYAQGYFMRGLIRLRLELKLRACEDLRKSKELGFPQADRLIRDNCTP